MANFDLLLDVHIDLVHWNMAWAFNHALRSLLERTGDATSKNLKFRELRRVAGISNRARTQTITETPRNVILLHDVA